MAGYSVGRVRSRTGVGPVLVEHLEHRLLWGFGESTRDALLHAWHQDRVSEGLPALLRVVHREDGPAVGGGAGRVEHLPGWQAPVGWVDRSDRRLVLILGSALELVNDAIAHGLPSLLRVGPGPVGAARDS